MEDHIHGISHGRRGQIGYIGSRQKHAKTLTCNIGSVGQAACENTFGLLKAGG